MTHRDVSYNMNILFIDFFRHFGGATQLAADVNIRLSIGHNVTVLDVYGICQPYLDLLKHAHISTHILLPQAKQVFIGYKNKALIRLWRILCQLPDFWIIRKHLVSRIHEMHPDIIWTTTDSALLFLCLSPELISYPKVRYVCTCLPSTEIKGYGRWLLKHHTSGILAISTETALQLENAGISHDKIHIVYDTINFAETINRSQKPPDSPLPGLERSPKIVLPASLYSSKGQHVAIKAVAHLNTLGLKSTLWLAGDKYGNDQSYIHELKDLVTHLGISDQVYFLGWRHDVPAIIHAADILVLPSRSEGFGHVILEAMLLRRPTVAPAVGGIKDSIQHKINGMNFPVDDDIALAQCIYELTINPDLAAALTKQAYQSITERFTPELHTERILNAFHNIVKGTL